MIRGTQGQKTRERQEKEEEEEEVMIKQTDRQTEKWVLFQRAQDELESEKKKFIEI